ncbi:MAG TPA: hypothetical protein VEW74_05220 [Candidatus Nitrosotalea sp.]|nr:hypothetical protein [Candidatus Nitrosotalea sp.]
MRRADRPVPIHCLPPGSALLALVAIVGFTGANPRTDPVAAACAQRNPSLDQYTFDMNVALRMRHLPWLGFRMTGTGEYVRGRTHVVRFDRMPFGAAAHQVDLSPLDPCMWPKSYVAVPLASRDGMATFDLHPRTVDPQDKNPLVDALVSLDAGDSTRRVLLSYAHGSIALALTPQSIGAYRLPSSADVDINMPGESLSGHADLTNYSIASTAAGASGVGRRK